ncbi:unnamed protein product [Effrenium voratum]|nr:unnamed protein product [Effrenium voratum]
MPASPSPGPRGYFPPGLVKDSVPTLALEELVRPTAAELKISAAEGHGAKTGAKSLCEIEVKEVAFDMHDEKVQEDLADRLIAFLDEGEFLLLASALTTNGYPREPARWMALRWRVVGASGLLARLGADLGSEPCAERVAYGSLLQELQRQGDRLQFRKLSGDGPETGWVSVRLKGKDLVLPEGDWASLEKEVLGPWKAHEDKVTAVLLDPTAPRLYTASWAEATVKCWHLQRRKPPALLWSLQTPGLVSDLALVAEELVTAVSANPMAKEGTVCHQADFKLRMAEMDDQLAAGDQLLRWSSPSKRSPLSAAHARGCQRLAFHAPTGRLASVSLDRLVVLDPDGSQALSVPSPHERRPRCLCWASGGDGLWTSDASGELRLWDLTGAQVMETKLAVENVSTLVPLGNTLVIAHETGFVFLEDGKQRQQYTKDVVAAGCRLDAGFCAAVGTNLLRYQLAEKASAQGMWTLPSKITSLCPLDGSTLIAAGCQDGTVAVLDAAQNLSLEELLDLSASNNPKPKPNRMAGPPAPHAPAQAQGASGRGNAAEVDMAPKQAMHTQDPAATQRAAAQEANMTMQMMHAPDSAAAAQANMMQMQMMQMVADSAAAQANMVPTQMMHMQNSAAAAQANMLPTQMMQMQNSAAQANMMSTQMMQMQQSAAAQANVAPTQMMQMNHSAVGAQANMQMMQMQQQVAAAQEANMAQMMQLQHSAAAQEMMQMQHSAAAQEANLAQMMQMQNSAAAQEMMHLQHAQEANMAQMLQMQHSPATQEATPLPESAPGLVARQDFNLDPTSATQDAFKLLRRMEDGQEDWLPDFMSLLGQMLPLAKRKLEGSLASGASEASKMEDEASRGRDSGNSGASERNADDEDVEDADPESGPRTHKAKDITSVLLRNLPLDYSQQKALDLIDGRGFRDLYDLLLWFPSKKNSRRQTSTIFVNFRSPEFAQRFWQEFHSQRRAEGKLNVSTASVQGFTNNFVKYWHLTQKEAGNICRPYFARDMLDQVTPETMVQARKIQDQLRNEVPRSEWTDTTLVIRNLPAEVEDQQQAMRWLADLGFGRGYTFFLYVPRKSNAMKNAASFAYVFVNYQSPLQAKSCYHGLQHKVFKGTPLSVVASKIQGQQACLDHFKNLSASGRLVPYVAEPSEDTSRSRSHTPGQEVDARVLSWQ